MAATYSNSSANTEISTQRLSCEHGKAHLKHSSTLANPGRRYWRCPRAPEGACPLFVWYEVPYEGKVREALTVQVDKMLTAEAMWYEADRDRKAVKALLDATNEKLLMAQDEILELEHCLALATVEGHEQKTFSEVETMRFNGMLAVLGEEMAEKLRFAEEERVESERKIQAVNNDLKEKLEELEKDLVRAEEEFVRSLMNLKDKEKEMEDVKMANYKLVKCLNRSKFYMKAWVGVVMFLLLMKVVLQLDVTGK